MSIVVVGLGDSITAGTRDTTLTRREQPFEGDDPESQYLYWAALADAEDRVPQPRSRW